MTVEMSFYHIYSIRGKVTEEGDMPHDKTFNEWLSLSKNKVPR